MTVVSKLTAPLLFVSLLSLGSGCTDTGNALATHLLTDKEALRTAYRHPQQTLDFFNVQADMTVVEIWPGNGWYTAILAPLLRDNGTLYAAHFDPKSPIPFFRNARSRYETRLKSHMDYHNVIPTVMAPAKQLNIAPAQSADRVLTFRNVHNWMRNNSEQDVFHAFYKALKPGGILGVVEHRAPNNYSFQQMVKSGYVTEGYVILLAEKAGFILSGRSEINQNPQDTKDHKNGVWSLPPTLRTDATLKSTMIRIGESDRMTLRFIKPLTE